MVHLETGFVNFEFNGVTLLVPVSQLHSDLHIHERKKGSQKNQDRLPWLDHLLQLDVIGFAQEDPMWLRFLWICIRDKRISFHRILKMSDSFNFGLKGGQKVNFLMRRAKDIKNIVIKH